MAIVVGAKLHTVCWLWFAVTTAVVAATLGRAKTAAVIILPAALIAAYLLFAQNKAGCAVFQITIRVIGIVQPASADMLIQCSVLPSVNIKAHLLSCIQAFIISSCNQYSVDTSGQIAATGTELVARYSGIDPAAGDVGTDSGQILVQIIYPAGDAGSLAVCWHNKFGQLGCAGWWRRAK